VSELLSEVVGQPNSGVHVSLQILNEVQNLKIYVLKGGSLSDEGTAEALKRLVDANT